MLELHSPFTWRNSPFWVIGVGAPPPVDTTAPTISGMSYTAPLLNLTLSEAAHVFFLASTNSTPIAGASVVSQVLAETPAAFGNYIRGSGASTYNALADLTGLAVDTWFIHAVGRDAAGNISATSVVTTYTVADTTAPTVTVMSYTPPNLTVTISETSTAFFLVSASATPIVGSSIVSQVLAGTPTKYGSFSASSGVNIQNILADVSGLAANTWYLHLAAQDAAGNITATGTVYSFVVSAADTTAPIITAFGISGDVISADLDEDATVYVLFNTSATALNTTTLVADVVAETPIAFASFAANVLGDNLFDATATIAGLTPGSTYYLHFAAKDAAGNISTPDQVVAYTKPAVGLVDATFNGTTQYLNRGAALTGAADNTSCSFCFVFKSSSATEQCLLTSQNLNFLMDVQSNGRIYMAIKDTANAYILNGELAATPTLLDGAEHEICGSYDGSTGVLKVFVDGVDKTGTPGTLTTGTVNWSGIDWYVGRFFNSSLFWNGKIKQAVLWTGVALDPSTVGVRDSMKDPAQRASLGGNNIIDFRATSLANFSTNNGTGGAFILNNGPLT